MLVGSSQLSVLDPRGVLIVVIFVVIIVTADSFSHFDLKPSRKNEEDRRMHALLICATALCKCIGSEALGTKNKWKCIKSKAEHA